MLDTQCVVCSHVFAGERPVRVIVHLGEGRLRAVCGGADHDMGAAGSDLAVLNMAELVARQRDLVDICAIAHDEIAEWRGGGWIIEPIDGFSGDANPNASDSIGSNLQDKRLSRKASMLFAVLDRLVLRLKRR